MSPALLYRPILFAIAGALFATAATAAPKSTEPNRAAVLQSVADCRKVADGAERLACYDKAVAELDQAESKGQVVVIDRDQVKTVRKQAFGLSLPAFTLFDHGPKEDKVDRITLTLDRAYMNGEQKWVFVATDGVTWAQTDSERINNDPHKGSSLSVREALMGSYFCNVDGQRAVRCERRR